MPQLQAKVCTNDCPYYRQTPGVAAPAHIHWPSWSLVDGSQNDYWSINDLTGLVKPDGTYDANTFAGSYPWFVGQGNRAPVAQLRVQ